ncbi:MAG TPA: MerR family transcriptional regulator [Gemmatimonadales bacterium]
MDLSDAPLYTLREVARQLGLPDSTVRYYRDAFAGYLPMLGAGRRRLYLPETVDALRVVARGFAERRSRADIEAALAALTGTARAPGETGLATRTNGGTLSRDEVLATILDGERERREAMWQMARELFRLGETLERQQAMLQRLFERATAGERALPGPMRESPVAVGGETVPVPPPAASPVDVDALRDELTRERELVDRLRRSKLDIERRAAQAEARLADAPQRSDGPRRSLLDRLMARDERP